MYPPCKQLYKIHAGCGNETVYYVSTPASNYINLCRVLKGDSILCIHPASNYIKSMQCRVLKGDSILCIHPCKQLNKVCAGCGKETVYYVSTLQATI